MKSKWPGINLKNTVLIQLSDETFHLSDTPVLIDNITYAPKDELHVTLAGKKVGTMLKNKIKHDPAIAEELEKIFDDIDWSFNLSGPIHILTRLSKKGTLQKSVILLIDMPGIAVFYKQLISRDLIPGITPVPPAHITLYTYNCPLGIGAASDDILDSLTEKSLPVDAFTEMLNLSRC